VSTATYGAFRARDHALEGGDRIDERVVCRRPGDLRRRFGRTEWRNRRRRRGCVADRPCERVELQLDEQLAEPRPIGLAHPHLVELKGQRQIFSDRY
jgi:hypothetical protein